jgi:dephospho-CoA kinase
MRHDIECLISFKIETKEDKRKLAHLIFEDQHLREKINSIIHPLVYQEIDQTIKENQDQTIILIDMPLLFEVGYEKKVDDTLLIYVPKSIQMKRIKERNPFLTYKEIEKRIRSQMPLNQKRKLANFIIDNRFDQERLYRNIDLVIRGIISEKQ